MHKAAWEWAAFSDGALAYDLLPDDLLSDDLEPTALTEKDEGTDA